jgi:hypothetical protein
MALLFERELSIYNLQKTPYWLLGIVYSRRLFGWYAQVMNGLNAAPTASASALSLLFFFVRCHFIIAARVIPKHAKTICKIIAMV